MADGSELAEDEISWDEVRQIASERFGVRRFRPGQRDLIEAVLRRKDALGILPTGAGKSLCYQLPALMLDGATVVVSPLIALMQDQYDHLERADIPAARLDSTLTSREQEEREREVLRGAHDVVLLTPERLQRAEHVEPLRRRGVSLFVVDEAHCVTQWGHDFRPAYLGLRNVIEQLGRPTVLALTATAPNQLAHEILGALGIPNGRIVNTGIERDNLHLEVLRTVNEEAKYEALRRVLSDVEGSVIVYAATTRKVDEIHRTLAAQGVAARRYHGKLRKTERADAQDAFMTGAARVIVATNAFGLGVDKPDVRAVVHFNFPESLESYYQEAGRAGRDGEPARAVLLYRLEDKRIRSFLMGGKHPTRDEALRFLHALIANGGKAASLDAIEIASGLAARRASVLASTLEATGVIGRRGRTIALRRLYTQEDAERFVGTFETRHTADRERLEEMMHYGQSTACRMRLLRTYFGEAEGDSCGHCDNCEHPMDERALAVAAQ